ncbi:MAG TPA: hypothetical protein VF534_06705 [Paraburkholderia sp.]
MNTITNTAGAAVNAPSASAIHPVTYLAVAFCRVELLDRVQLHCSWWGLAVGRVTEALLYISDCVLFVDWVGKHLTSAVVGQNWGIKALALGLYGLYQRRKNQPMTGKIIPCRQPDCDEGMVRTANPDGSASFTTCRHCDVAEGDWREGDE